MPASRTPMSIQPRKLILPGAGKRCRTRPAKIALDRVPLSLAVPSRLTAQTMARFAVMRSAGRHAHLGGDGRRGEIGRTRTQGQVLWAYRRHEVTRMVG